MKLKILPLLILTLPLLGKTQTHDWWADNVNWDGVSHWSEYITTSPRFLGPNALPIPEQNNGLLPKEHQLSITGNAHFMEGDQTSSMALALDLVLVPRVVSFNVFWVPFEIFDMSHELKTERSIFHTFYNSSVASGDVQLRTNIQILEQAQHRIDLRMRIGFRFANSNHMGAARFTDAPGYFFDGGFGKEYELGNWKLRPSLMGGFYVWQTNLDDRFQNDALLAGVALDLERGNTHFSSSLRGYFGYIDNGDKPMTLDFQVRQKLDGLSVFISGSYGVWDNLYDRIGLGLTFIIPTKIMPGRTPR